MNNRERAKQIADEHGNDAYNVALRLAGHENEIRGLKRQLQEAIDNVKRHANKIEADAVRAAAFALSQLSVDESDDWAFNYLMSHAKKLENQND